MFNPKKIIALITTLSLFIISAPSTYALSSIDKIQGENRYETAALIADKQNYTTAILINSDKSLADGLSASPLAGALNAPILLTQKDSLPQETSSRLHTVKKVYIVGGVQSISNSVEKSLQQKNIETIRISGNDRIETSYNVAREISKIKPINKVILTNAYKGEADAMSIACVAARDQIPIILTDGNSVPFDLKDIESYVLGGSSIMSDNLVNTTHSTRIGGKDRFETNRRVIQKFYPNTNNFYLAYGWKLVDALTGSPLAKNSPIFLVDDTNDKSMLKGSTSLTSLGGIKPIILDKSLNAANGFNPSHISKNYAIDIIKQIDPNYEIIVKNEDYKVGNESYYVIHSNPIINSKTNNKYGNINSADYYKVDAQLYKYGQSESWVTRYCIDKSTGEVYLEYENNLKSLIKFSDYKSHLKNSLKIIVDNGKDLSPFIDVMPDKNNINKFTLQFYEIVQDGSENSHLVTWGWYSYNFKKPNQVLDQVFKKVYYSKDTKKPRLTNSQVASIKNRLYKATGTTGTLEYEPDFIAADELMDMINNYHIFASYFEDGTMSCIIYLVDINTFELYSSNEIGEIEKL